MFLLNQIKFKKILTKDLKKVFKWRNDIFIRSKMLNQKKITYKDHLIWYKKLHKNNSEKIYIISYKQKQIGVAQIKKINLINGTCTWGYYISERSFRYLALLVEYKFIDLMFKNINIRKIWGETLSTNKKILKIHKFLGFLIEGAYKKHVKVNKKYEDVILTSLFKKNWKMSKKRILQSLNIKN